MLTDEENAALKGAAILASGEEGFSTKPYQDSVGVWTYLYGSTRDPAGNPVTANTPPGTPALGLQLLMRDMTSAVIDIVRVTKVALNVNQLTALADFVYNLGQGTYNGSTLLKLLNDGNYAGAAAQIDLFDHAGGRELAGLLRRRQLETLKFDTPVVVSITPTTLACAGVLGGLSVESSLA